MGFSAGTLAPHVPEAPVDPSEWPITCHAGVVGMLLPPRLPLRGVLYDIGHSY